jgi:hypothetical protein
MLFVGNIGNDAMEKLAEVIEKACPEHKVLILNGDYTDNKEAEGLTKEELVRMQNGYYEGRDKLLVITNMMGTRSYSVPEIQACLFMQEGGDVYPYMQKYSRCLTPGFGKKFGHIFDFAFDQSKTRNSVMSVAVEAALLIRQKGKTYPEAVREVMNSVNIKDMISGQWMDADTIIKAFEDNNKLLEIANAHTRITIEDLTSEEIEAFGELAKQSSGSKAEKSKIDKIVETGKTFESGKSANSKAKKDPLKAVVEKAVRMINGSATTVLALSNYQGESFLECVDLIENNAEMYKEFVELYGVGPDTIKRLAHRLEISTLDMIVRMSKYNTTQKHIENNALGIIKDDPKVWTKFFLNRELSKFIKSKHCKKILVVAGGHGSEIDVLVDMFGIDIVHKIVYTDKYAFLCNQIKRKYPSITVMQGDFKKLEFDMKFDLVVGNPPFQKADKGGRDDDNLWPSFLKLSHELLNKDGHIVFITPGSWASLGTNNESPGSTIRKKFFDKKQTLLVDFTIGEYFNVGSTFTGYVIKNSEPDNNVKTTLIFKDKVIEGKFSDYPCFSLYYSNSEFIDIVKSFRASTHYSMMAEDPYHTQRAAMPKKLKDGEYVDTKSNTHPYRAYHTNAQTTYYSKYKNDFHNQWKAVFSYSGTWKVEVTNDCSLTDASMCVLTDTEEEAKSVQSVLQSAPIKFLIDKVFRWGGYYNGLFIKWIPALPMDKIYTDDNIYELLFTPEQTAILKDLIVKSIKIKKVKKSND